MLYQVKDLSPEQRHAAEILLGHPVAENEVVSIRQLGPTTIVPSKFSPEERIEALRALEDRFAKVPQSDFSDVCNFSNDEEEAVVSEALRSTRPNCRPLGRESSPTRPSLFGVIPGAVRRVAKC